MTNLNCTFMEGNSFTPAAPQPQALMNMAAPVPMSPMAAMQAQSQAQFQPQPLPLPLPPQAPMAMAPAEAAPLVTGNVATLPVEGGAQNQVAGVGATPVPGTAAIENSTLELSNEGKQDNNPWAVLLTSTSAKLTAMDNAAESVPEEQGINHKLLEWVDLMSHSSFAPGILRAHPIDSTKQHQADIYLLYHYAKQLGISPYHIFDAFFIIPTNSGGAAAKLGMYVQTKAAICAKRGTWTVEVDPNTATATARGSRFDTGRVVEATYTGYDGQLKGKMKFVPNRGWIGVGNWADKWPEMIRVRALGRLLDQLFPDLLCGLSNAEELTDQLQADELAAAKESKTAARVKRALAKSHTAPQAAKEEVAMPVEAAPESLPPVTEPPADFVAIAPSEPDILESAAPAPDSDVPF